LAFLIAASLKIVWEIFEGRANYKTTIAINASLGVILSIGFALKWNYLALVIFASISEAGFLTTFPIITSKIWGEKVQQNLKFKFLDRPDRLWYFIFLCGILQFDHLHNLEELLFTLLKRHFLLLPSNSNSNNCKCSIFAFKI
jgi:hypothetical protein